MVQVLVLAGSVNRPRLRGSPAAPDRDIGCRKGLIERQGAPD